MKAVKWIAIALGIYVAIVVAFESLLGIIQPTPDSTMVITTFDADGTAHDRVVTKLEVGDQLYVAANHWPRQWYHTALENPEVRATVDGETSDRTAVPVSGAEHDRVSSARPLPFAFRVLTGFPPRYFVRLDPR